MATRLPARTTPGERTSGVRQDHCAACPLADGGVLHMQQLCSSPYLCNLFLQRSCKGARCGMCFPVVLFQEEWKPAQDHLSRWKFECESCCTGFCRLVDLGGAVTAPSAVAAAKGDENAAQAEPTGGVKKRPIRRAQAADMGATSSDDDTPLLLRLGELRASHWNAGGAQTAYAWGHKQRMPKNGVLWRTERICTSQQPQRHQALCQPLTVCACTRSLRSQAASPSRCLRPRSSVRRTRAAPAPPPLLPLREQPVLRPLARAKGRALPRPALHRLRRVQQGRRAAVRRSSSSHTSLHKSCSKSRSSSSSSSSSSGRRAASGKSRTSRSQVRQHGPCRPQASSSNARHPTPCQADSKQGHAAAC